MVDTIVLGMQWGDEAKGKLVDILSEDHDVVVRFQGGGNAGHTVVIGDQKYALRLMPSGILRGKKCIIGNGVAVYPAGLIKEINELKNRGVEINPENFMISNLANLTASYHIALDAAMGKKIGTTGNGIGPTYADKRARTPGLLVNDLFDVNELERKVRNNTDFANWVLKFYDEGPLNSGDVLKDLLYARERLLPFVRKDTREIILANIGKLLFEGAQGTLLDCDLGTFPNVTSSNTTIGGAYIGSGVYLNFDEIIGVLKAYTTRVGGGPSPTEQKNEIGERLVERGHEFGTVTGRKRRCGWLDLNAARYAVEVNGIKEICLTKLDVLDEEDEIKVCTGYKINGQSVNYFPVIELEKCEPVYETLPGWKSDTTKIRRSLDLPKNARDYVKRIQDYLHVPITRVGVGNRRDQMISVR